MQKTSRVPDGGWGWIVALSTFFTSFIVDGVKYSFGIIFIELLNTFQKSKSETSLIMSMQIGAFLLTGPLNGAVVNRFGSRKVCAVGTFVAFVGFLLSAFATSVMWLCFSFGIVGGIGFCLLNMSSFLILPLYFDRHRALAMGIGAMGCGVGTLVFNPVSEILIDKYTWRGTLLIEAGFILNGLVCALVLRKPDTKTQPAEVGNEYVGQVLEEFKNDKNCENNQEKLLNEEIGNEKLNTKLVPKSSDRLVFHEKNSASKKDIIQNEVDAGEIVGEMDGMIEKSTNIKKKRWLSLSPLRNPGFIVYMLSSLLVEWGMNTPFAFLPDMMVQEGYTKQDAVWVMFIIGLLNTISRVVIGFIADLPCFSRVYMCNSLLMANGLLMILSPYCFNYASFIAFGVLFGFTAGGSNVLRIVLIPELFGVEMVADCFGIYMCFGSIAAFTGLPKAGALYDVTGSYAPPFIMAGTELILAGVLVFLVPRVLSRWKRKKAMLS